MNRLIVTLADDRRGRPQLAGSNKQHAGLELNAASSDLSYFYLMFGDHDPETSYQFVFNRIFQIQFQQKLMYSTFQTPRIS